MTEQHRGDNETENIVRCTVAIAGQTYPQTLSPPPTSHEAKVLGMLRHQSHPRAADPCVSKTVARTLEEGSADSGGAPAILFLLPLLLLILLLVLLLLPDPDLVVLRAMSQT